MTQTDSRVQSIGRLFLVVAVISIIIFVGSASLLAWDDVSKQHDLPWMGNGKRARMFETERPCFMCPTGYRHLTRWGSYSVWGEEPYDTVTRAFAYLRKRGVLESWPIAKGSGSINDGTESYEPRVAPYEFWVVMIKPTVHLDAL